MAEVEVASLDVGKKEDKENCESFSPNDLEKKIIRQVYYYFGDINLQKDLFLKKQSKLDDGWIPLDVMLKFNRLKRLTNDAEIIMTALKKSADKLMEVDLQNKKLRRSPDRPLPIQNEDRRRELMSRTLYVQGFPQAASLDNLVDYFYQFGAVDDINMRWDSDEDKNSFQLKGSVFAMFTTREKAEEFLKLESVKYQDTELIRKWQSVYLEEKREEMKKSKIEAGGQKKGDSGFYNGSIMHLKGITGNVTREDLKQTLKDLGADVVFIKFDKGDSESWVRLQGEDSVKNFLKILKESRFELKECDIEVRALEDEEEKIFLKKAMKEKERRRHYNYRKNKGGGGRGGFQGNRKRRGGEPPAIS